RRGPRSQRRCRTPYPARRRASPPTARTNGASRPAPPPWSRPGRPLLAPPLEPLPEVREARFADPPIPVRRRVAFVQHFRQILRHELGPAELAVVVIPVRARGRPPGPAEHCPVQIPFLPLEPPVILRDHLAPSAS